MRLWGLFLFSFVLLSGCSGNERGKFTTATPTATEPAIDTGAPTATEPAIDTGAPAIVNGTPNPLVAPPESEWTPALTDHVKEACSRCHLMPGPDVFPKRRWSEKIYAMVTLPGPPDAKKLTKEEVGLALAYYDRRAPEELAKLEQAPEEPGRIRFRREEFTTPQLESTRIPATANVRFLPLTDKLHRDLLVADMRSKSLTLLKPWDYDNPRTLEIFAAGMNYPCHTQLVDLDGAFAKDILVASIGQMNPSNEANGSVIALLSRGEEEPRKVVLREHLGRTADARAVDLDGDGDQDILVGSFGFHGPGELLLLENKTEDWSRPRFTPSVLDARDGYIHIEPVDLDRDGKMDFVTLLSQEYEEVIAYMNKGKMRFDPVTIFKAPHPAWGSSGIQVVDFDGDGDQDILESNGDTLDSNQLAPFHGVTLIENKGGMTFVPHNLAHLYGCMRAVACDLDRDGDNDIVAVSFLPQFTEEIWKDLDSIIWIENSPEGFRPYSLEKGKCYHPTVDVADYNNDGKQDIAVGNYIWMDENGIAFFQADQVTLLTADW